METYSVINYLQPYHPTDIQSTGYNWSMRVHCDRKEFNYLLQNCEIIIYIENVMRYLSFQTEIFYVCLEFRL